MPAKLISVVMPVRKMRAFTHQAITSILEQSHHSLELLLVGQVDQPAPADLPADARIRWITRAQPGIISALNTGLACANGDYIARMDDDDIAHPERLSLQLEHLRSNQLDICGARIRFFSDNNNPVGRGNQRYSDWLNNLTTPHAINTSIFVESPIPHPTFFAHRSIWQRLGGYQDNNWPEDYDLLLRAWQLCLRMGKPDPVLLNWREHDNRATYTDERYNRQAFVAAKSATLCTQNEKLNLSSRPIWIAGTGRNARYWFDAMQDNAISVSGFVDLERSDIKTRKRNQPVINYETFWANNSNAFLIIALGSAHARSQCVNGCIEAGMTEMVDFIAAW